MASTPERPKIGVLSGASARDATSSAYGRSQRARSVAERWALLVLRVVELEEDPRTLNQWACAVGVSRSTLRENCRLVHISPHDARDFARVLRAVCRSTHEWQPETMLDVSDVRTLRRLEHKAGVRLVSGGPPPDPAEFVSRQRFIHEHNPGLLEVRRILLDTHT